MFSRLPLIGFGCLLLLGVFLHGDYSIPMDEPTMHNLGIKAVEYIQGVSAWPDDPANRFHGPLVEIVIHSVQRLFGASALTSMVAVRHMITYLFFVLGVTAFYFLAKRYLRSDHLALLGATFLVLSPRIFGHAFFNSRDIPFLALFTLSMLCLSLLLERRTLLSAVAFGAVSAAALSVRSMGVFLPLFALVLLLPRCRKDPKATCTLLVVSFLSLTLFTYAFWPLLWANPVGHFLDAVSFSSSFASTPAYYVPVWIALTTPMLYTVLGVIGMVVCLRCWKEHLLPLLWFFVPLLVMILMGAGIYNGWRHVFFLYPALLLMALVGFQFLWTRIHQKLLIGVTAFFLLTTCVWMVRNHPLESVYFALPAQFIEGLERDYWAVSSRAALEAIAKQDDDPIISIFATNRITYINAYAYYSDRFFFEAPSDSKANYIIDFTETQDYSAVMPPEMLLTEIKAGGLTVASVYKGLTHAGRIRDAEAEKRKLEEIKALPRLPWEYGSYQRKTGN